MGIPGGGCSTLHSTSVTRTVPHSGYITDSTRRPQCVLQERVLSIHRAKASSYRIEHYRQPQLPSTSVTVLQFLLFLHFLLKTNDIQQGFMHSFDVQESLIASLLHLLTVL